MYTDPKFTPTDEQKLNALDHVLYEIEMFLYLKFLNPNVPPQQVSLYNNAVVESFLLHSRVLKDFFGRNPEGDDISCEHYDYPKSKVAIAPEIEKRFNKSLAHLTYSRLCFEGIKKAWLDTEIFPPLLDKIYDFSTKMLLRTDLSPLQKNRFEDICRNRIHIRPAIISTQTPS